MDWHNLFDIICGKLSYMFVCLITVIHLHRRSLALKDRVRVVAMVLGSLSAIPTSHTKDDQIHLMASDGMLNARV